MVYKRLIVLLGVLLCSQTPAVGQTTPRILLARQHVEPTTTALRTVSVTLSTASFLPSQDAEKSPAYFSPLFAGAHERTQNPARLLPIEDVKTVLFTASSLPLVQLWSRRLELNAFQNTLRIQTLQPYPGGPRSIHLSGLSLSFHFGREVRTERLIPAWRCLPRIVGGVLN
jgi:hypothetical protein